MRKYILSKTKLYRVWSSMKNRCISIKSPRFKDYGGRGIKVCDKWLTFNGFKEDMLSSYKEGLTIERIDNNKGYLKENCKWIGRKEQANNTRNIEKAKKFVYMGKKDTIKNWAKYFGIRRETLSKRLLHLGWDFNRAINTLPNYSNKPDNYIIKRDKLGRFI